MNRECGVNAQIGKSAAAAAKLPLEHVASGPDVESQGEIAAFRRDVVEIGPGGLRVCKPTAACFRRDPAQSLLTLI